VVTQIKNSAEQVNSAASEIAEGNTNLSQRTEEQASGLEETASSMEEFTATVKQNSDSAQEANTLGAAAATNARKGGESMTEVVTTMNNINASSQKIVEIISVIDGIAFQTNILALNAAVEAARAGEQGRGFAVVAGEVRSLAQRSAAAAKEIKELIGDTVAKVTAGSGQVEAAGATMGELVSSVQRVTDIMSDIAVASREQSTGIDQVNKAIAQMDEVTQQNSALVEEAAAAAGALEEQAKALLGAVSTFKVSGVLAAGASPRPTAPKPAIHAQPAPKKPAFKSVTARHKAVASISHAPSNGHTNGHSDTQTDEWANF
jgi:methyl-accepting chemotaxis protein